MRVSCGRRSNPIRDRSRSIIVPVGDVSSVTVTYFIRSLTSRRSYMYAYVLSRFMAMSAAVLERGLPICLLQ